MNALPRSVDSKRRFAFIQIRYRTFRMDEQWLYIGSSDMPSHESRVRHEFPLNSRISDH